MTKRKSSLGIPFGYQVPTSNQPAPPPNHYQVPSNRPATINSTVCGHLNITIVNVILIYRMLLQNGMFWMQNLLK